MYNVSIEKIEFRFMEINMKYPRLSFKEKIEKAKEVTMNRISYFNSLLNSVYIESREKEIERRAEKKRQEEELLKVMNALMNDENPVYEKIYDNNGNVIFLRDQKGCLIEV